MPPFDDFVHISTGIGTGTATSHPAWNVSGEFFNSSKGQRPWTEGLIVDSLRSHHPKHHLTVAPAFLCDLLAFGNARDDVAYFPHGETTEALIERLFMPPARRYGDEAGGAFANRVIFGCYDYVFKDNTFLVYIVEGADTLLSKTRVNYILVEDLKQDNKAAAQKQADELIAECTKWGQELHNEVLVFDQGFWQKSPELWQNIQNSNWEDVILEREKKKAIIDDVLGFFHDADRYKEFGIPWKRGVIFYGPPGNGKTISTKALMHDVSKRVSPHIESLYVKTLTSFGGPEYSIRQIFLRARQMAPCLLIFEDIDSLVSPMARSYFLNEVDGLESNHGILMIGSTNHLEQLDPGIAKRPSRFDRKYVFDDPTRDERIQYAEYWRNKLRNNKNVDFPKELTVKIADITDDFSFAYMKEAFVAALMILVGKGDEKPMCRYREDDLSENVFWQEFKRQVKNLRKEMEEDDSEATSPLTMMSGMWPSMSGIDDKSGRTRPMDMPGNAMPRYM